MFITIAITPEKPVEEEASKIAMLLDGGIRYVHLRHPEATEAELAAIIEDVPERLRGRVRLHSHFALIDRCGLGGAHLNSRWSSYYGRTGTLSRSCHTLKELADMTLYEYVTLSPIYDSISKEGYRSAFNPAAVCNEIAGRNVIALGGVTPDRFRELAEAGFIGAAMLGYLWGTPSLIELQNRIQTVRKSAADATV